MCNEDLEVIWRKSQIKQYCPYYGNGEFIYGTFYTKRFSRLRLGLHFCDDSPAAQ